MTDQPTKSQYTITESHRITGRSRTTIQKHVKNGKLSYTLDDDGNKQIAASELVRVYGDDCDFSRVAPATETEPKREEGVGDDVRKRLDDVQQLLDTLTNERERERKQLESQIEHLQDALATAQEGQNRVTKLLEHRSTDSDQWRESMNAMTKKMDQLQSKHQEEIQRVKKALAEKRRKGFWRSLFG